MAYILRQTLGWLDEDGLPLNESVEVSYNDLIKKAGVSRGAIGKALQQAVACGFLECNVSGEASAKGQDARTAEYQLRWDSSPTYAKTLSDFKGFYAGEGNRTPIPNSFFDVVVPSEPLAVTKVVGAVIRHTVGFETRYGGRRTSHPMSCSYVQRYTLLSNRRNLIEAIKHAVEIGYIVKVKAGVFSHRTSEQEAATYSIRWLVEQQNIDRGSKMTPVPQDQSKIDTKGGSKRTPANRFKNDTSIEKKKQNNILKQQAAADLESEFLNRLASEGFALKTAKQLIEKRGVEVVERQLAWLDARKPENRLAMLRKAIEDDWEEPATLKAKSKIALARKREAIKAMAKEAEEGIAAERKKRRQERKRRLLAEWELADDAQRAIWIEKAMARVRSDAMRNILAKQSPITLNPHFQVLDEVAFDRGLDPVTECYQSPSEKLTTHQQAATSIKRPQSSSGQRQFKPSKIWNHFNRD